MSSCSDDEFAPDSKGNPELRAAHVCQKTKRVVVVAAQLTTISTVDYVYGPR